MASDYGKKVARAARTGGGTTSRGDRSWGFYFVIALIFAIGIPLIYFSNQQRIEDQHPDATDHWHSAIGFYICGKFTPSLPDNFSTTRAPIHTHGDGIVHIEPYEIDTQSPTYSQDLENATGKNATLGKFVTHVDGMKLTKTSVTVPGQPEKKNGAKCGDKPAKVKYAIWKTPTTKSPTLYTGDPNEIRLKDDMLITVAFVPEGTTVPKPPSKDNLPNLENLKNGEHKSGATTTTAPATTTTKKN